MTSTPGVVTAAAADDGGEGVRIVRGRVAGLGGAAVELLGAGQADRRRAEAAGQDLVHVDGVVAPRGQAGEAVGAGDADPPATCSSV